MRLRAMAKINLGLDVVGKRTDGYHEVRMIMQTIQMYDVLEIEKKAEPGIVLTTNIPYVPTDERNLVYKAAKMLMDEFHVEEGLSMRLEKFIPVAAGMAGGSTDVDAVKNGDLDGVISRMGNVFEPGIIGKYPVIQEIKDLMENHGARRAMMSGSGPTVFGIFDDKEKMEQAAAALRESKLAKTVFATEVF